MMKYTIDGVDLENERLLVHGENLVNIINKSTYIEAVFYLLRGFYPSSKEIREFNWLLNRSMNSLSELLESNKLFESISNLNISYERKLIACMAIINENEFALSKCDYISIFPNIRDQNDLSIGLANFALVPMLVCLFLSKSRFCFLKEKCNREKSYNDILSLAFTGGLNMSLGEKHILDKLLIALYAGFGITTPSIILPRFSASTKATMTLNLIAGLTGSGSAHVGACSEMMLLLDEVKDLTPNDIKIKIRLYVESGRKIPGYGHPLLYKDPRTAELYQLALKWLPGNRYLCLYRLISDFMLNNYHLNPNIDAIVAALLSALDICPQLGSVIFLFARMPAMIAHSLDKKSRAPFGLKRSEARERFERFPVDWI